MAKRGPVTFDDYIEGLARVVLSDFDYPTRDAEGEAADKLMATIERAIDRWIKKNCSF